MSRQLDPCDPIPRFVQQDVVKQIDRAIRSLQGSKAGLSDAAIHDARKRFREIRGLLRLVSEDLGDKVFHLENQTFRNAGRPLSEIRDAKVLIDTLDDLAARFRKRVKPQSIVRLRRALVIQRRHVRHRVIHQDRAVVGIVKELRSARKRVKGWLLHDRGWKSIKGGLERVYAKGRRAMIRTRSDRSEEAFHEWRKRTKDLRYELELLQSRWPKGVKTISRQARALTEALGDEHDLAMLWITAQQVLGDPLSIEDEQLYVLIAERRATLQRKSAELGEKLFKKKPHDFVRFIRRIGG